MIISNKRQLNKKIIINSFGGKCQICGYDKCISALAFHHKNPKEKEFDISKIAGKSKLSYNDIKELEKCILVCHNCHSEIHSGFHSNAINDIPPLDIQEFLE